MPIKVKIPTEVRMFSKKYPISYKEHMSEVSFDKRSTLLGEVHFDTNTIRIFRNKDYPIEEVWTTLIHEVIHIIENNLEMEFKEDDVQKLSVGIFHFLIENNLMEV